MLELSAGGLTDSQNSLNGIPTNQKKKSTDWKPAKFKSYETMGLTSTAQN